MKNKNKIFGFIVLVSVIGGSLALIACNLDDTSSDYMPTNHIAYDISGKWRANVSGWYQIDINNKRFILSDYQNNYMTVENLTWREVENNGAVVEIPKDQYPRGFEFTGKITQNKNMQGNEFARGQTGVKITRTIYIHNDQNSTVYSGRKSDILYKK